ncbi:putative ATP-dependent endonuclease of the OLD family [Fervidobacterium changbaicum]|uniref:AAA family ATPase n=2 Tax=Fervidobacterium TaxID=2422 RepID=A0AAI8CK08_FERIS|nr:MULTISPECIES: AAA family ATPase [Fervidobacterium]AMW31994.1 AAA family ATPase [Fervidobacterium islandicum]QAV33777.1 DUF2813 domain-containing protein [Fervidobacterium changbaicum]SDH82325.1 putative ATP-dependent endonuclease of the OLD family [Fervidobacterium changbaicum]
MIRLKSIFIKNYRSIGSEGITIEFPENQPVVIIGENNSGKTNILRAVDVLFGEWNPKYKEFEAWDFFNRSEENIIELKAEIEQFDGMLRESSSTLKRLELKVEKGKQNVLTIINEDGSNDERQANYVREQIASIFIMSERNLAYQLSYANKYTLLSRVTKRFHESLVENKERVEALKHYYESIIDVFNEVEEFKEFKKMISGSMNNFLSNMSYALGIDFSAYDPSNYYKNLRLVPVENNVVRELEELGTGQQQILAISLAYAYAKAFKSDSSLILIIDEPESHLHPMAQKYVAKVLYEMAKNGLQVIISTHSPYFVDLEYLEGINVVRRENGSTRVKQIRREGLARYCQEHGATKASPDKIVPFYAKSATPSILRGLFSKKVVLVEGPSEELALPIYLEKVGLDLVKEGIDVISVGGKGEIPKWWRFFTVFDIPCYVCFDNDSSKDNGRKKTTDILNTIGMAEKNFYNDFIEDNWVITASCCVFEKDFEDSLRKHFKEYTMLEENVRNQLGDSKPLVAREVALALCTSHFREDDEGWQKFRKLKDVLLKLRR